MITKKLRDDMMFLRGQLAALGFIPDCDSHKQQIYDFFESIENQYKAILEGVLEENL